MGKQKLTSEQVNQLSDQYIIKPMGDVPLAVDRGKGLHFWDYDGNEYLDAVSGEWVVNLGYLHPLIKESIISELENIDYVTPVFNNLKRAKLAEKLVSLASPRMKKVLFALSGAGAVEGAMHLAMRANGGNDFVCLGQAFHGTTFGAMGLNYTHPKMIEGVKGGLERYLPRQIRVPNYYCYRCPFDLIYPNCEIKCAKHIQWAITRQGDAKVAGVIIELFQANGCMVPAPREYVKMVKDICLKQGVAFIIDEVQTALCRAGEIFLSNYYQADPDLIVMGKAIGAGFPLSAVVAAEGYTNLKGWEAGFTLMSTPPICTGSLAMLDVMIEQNLPQNSKQIGEYMVNRLREMMDKYTIIGDVRGLGLMIGVELVIDRKTKEPANDLAQYFYEWALNKERLLLGKTGPVFGNYGNVIKLKPAVNITKNQAEEILKRFERAVEAAQKKLDNK